MKCPVCSGDAVEQLYDMDRFELVRCADCGLVFQSMLDSLDRSGMIREIYDTKWVRMKEHAASGDLYNHYLFSSHLVDSYGSPGDRLLEIGCGTGEFLYLMMLMGRQVTGIEPSEKSCEFARSRYQLEVINTMWDAALLGDSEKFDSVVFWHVLEHMPNPAEFLTEAASRLKPGGKVFLSVPSNDCMDNQVQKSASPIYTERDHLFHFAINNLPLLLSKAGLAVQTMFLWEGPGRLKTDWELYKRTLPATGFTELRDEYSFLAWLRNNRMSHELFCVAEKKDL